MDSSSGSVVNPLFCTQCPLDLAFTTKPPGDKKRGADLSTVDVDGNVLFRTKYSLRKNLTHFQDVRRRTLLTMMTKVVTVHDSWQAFAGDSTDDKDRVFNMRRSSNTPPEDVWLVFLAANTKEEVCDFKIKGSYHKKIYTFYKGDSSSIVAQEKNKPRKSWKSRILQDPAVYVATRKRFGDERGNYSCEVSPAIALPPGDSVQNFARWTPAVRRESWLEEEHRFGDKMNSSAERKKLKYLYRKLLLRRLGGGRRPSTLLEEERRRLLLCTTMDGRPLLFL
ncbi:Protein LURP-one-related 15 [Platanthera zijinensis]|uniref:Protein LURP-one-related 15 n=1 Tax=Platanthera zijinensis TaxID=2320716 RepID=A0AAP0B4Z9_9ASPA